MPFNNRYQFITDAGYSAMRQIQHAVPMVEKAVFTVFKKEELPEMVFDNEGYPVYNLLFHEEIAGNTTIIRNLEDE
jgi:hypothetical protein